MAEVNLMRREMVSYQNLQDERMAKMEKDNAELNKFNREEPTKR